jgi:hypothetical protein
MQTFVEREQVSTVIGMWPVHVLMTFIVVSLLYVQSAGRAPALNKLNREAQKIRRQ